MRLLGQAAEQAERLPISKDNIAAGLARVKEERDQDLEDARRRASDIFQFTMFAGDNSRFIDPFDSFPEEWRPVDGKPVSQDVVEWYKQRGD